MLLGTVDELNRGTARASCLWKKNNGKLRLSCRVLGTALLLLQCNSVFGINILMDYGRAENIRAFEWASNLFGLWACAGHLIKAPRFVKW